MKSPQSEKKRHYRSEKLESKKKATDAAQSLLLLQDDEDSASSGFMEETCACASEETQKDVVGLLIECITNELQQLRMENIALKQKYSNITQVTTEGPVSSVLATYSSELSLKIENNLLKNELKMLRTNIIIQHSATTEVLDITDMEEDDVKCRLYSGLVWLQVLVALWQLLGPAKYTLTMWGSSYEKAGVISIEKTRARQEIKCHERNVCSVDSPKTCTTPSGLTRPPSGILFISRSVLT